MKTSLFLFCCLFAAVYCLPNPHHEPGHKVNDELKKCAEEHEIDLVRGEKLIKHQEHTTSDNNKEKCFLACYLKNRGYIVNGKLSFEKLYEAHKKHVPEQAHTAIKATFDECEKNFHYEGKGKCDVAYELYNCAAN